MSYQQAILLLSKLSKEKQEEVFAYIKRISKETSDKKEERKIGLHKGFITYMADDFDEPLEEMSEYM